MKRMNKQAGSALTIVLGVVGIVAVIIGVLAFMAFGAYNTANKFDQAVKYQHENNKNVLSTYNQKLVEAAQVPDMQRDDLIKVATAAMEGRYGKDGSKAVFQMLQEQNPTLDPKLYTKLQQIIEEGRDKFEASQTRLLDIKRSYEVALGSAPQGFVMHALGFPRTSLDQYNIVITDGVDKAFKTGRDTAVKLR